MSGWRLLAVGMLAAMLGACGGNADLTCDEVRAYQLAAEGKRVKAPDGLDDLDPLREVPVPEAAPRDPRSPGSTCIDRPPQIKISGD